ncbi:hypothetical protein NIES3974_05290 [Calothrix sp. NIES-3974]|nr:hypothetical protein NIES3974_05290 [Calothrix sp. NIES-3974]
MAGVLTPCGTRFMAPSLKVQDRRLVLLCMFSLGYQVFGQSRAIVQKISVLFCQDFILPIFILDFNAIANSSFIYTVL